MITLLVISFLLVFEVCEDYRVIVTYEQVVVQLMLPGYILEISTFLFPGVQGKPNRLSIHSYVIILPGAGPTRYLNQGYFGILNHGWYFGWDHHI
jgi:hypothetical protein